MIAKTDKHAILISLGSLVLLVILHIIPLPWESRLGQEFENAGHIFMFGLYALIILVSSEQLFGRRHARPIWHYLLAGGLAILTGAVMEYIQQFVGRDTDIWDFLRDVVGTISFLALYATIDRFGALGTYPLGRRTRAMFRIGATGAVVLMLIPLLSAVSLNLYRRAIFPSLCRFEYQWDRSLVRTQRADFSQTSVPDGWPQARHRHVGRLALRAGRYPGITLDEPIADWGRFQNLEFDLYNAADTAITLIVRIDDVRYRTAPDDRFNRALNVVPGGNSIVIPLSEVASGPRQRQMDMSNIHSLILFADRLKTPLTIYVDEIRLY